MKSPEARRSPAADLDDLRYRYYRDTWEKLPDFDALKPETVGKLPNGVFSLSFPVARNGSFGFVFEGSLIVPKDGDYTFHLDSDDGSRLTVDRLQLVAYDGIHGEGKENRPTIELKQGRRAIRLDYFQAQQRLWPAALLVRPRLLAPAALGDQDADRPVRREA